MMFLICSIVQYNVNSELGIQIYLNSQFLILRFFCPSQLVKPLLNKRQVNSIQIHEQ